MALWIIVLATGARYTILEHDQTKFSSKWYQQQINICSIICVLSESKKELYDESGVHFDYAVALVLL